MFVMSAAVFCCNKFVERIPHVSTVWLCAFGDIAEKKERPDGCGCEGYKRQTTCGTLRRESRNLWALGSL